MKDVEKATNFFVNMVNDENLKEVVKRIMATRGIIIIARIGNINALPDIQRVFDESGINYISPLTGLPDFKLFTHTLEELKNPEKIAALVATYGHENEQTMSR